MTYPEYLKHAWSLYYKGVDAEGNERLIISSKRSKYWKMFRVATKIKMILCLESTRCYKVIERAH